MSDDKENKTLEKISRREFIRRSVFGGLRTAGFVLVQYGGLKLGLARCFQEEPTKEKDSLEVRYFAHDIYLKVSNEYLIPKKANFPLIVVGYFLGDAVGGYAVKNYSQIQRRFIALTGGTIGSLVDAESTYLFAKHMDDKRFFEYGFDNYFCEGNPGLPQHPSPSELYYPMSVRTTIWAAISFTFPFLGRGYFGMSPFIVANNAKAAWTIKKCLEIGDNVKSMIEKGNQRQEIKQYIKNYKT